MLLFIRLLDSSEYLVYFGEMFTGKTIDYGQSIEDEIIFLVHSLRSGLGHLCLSLLVEYVLSFAKKFHPGN